MDDASLLGPKLPDAVLILRRRINGEMVKKSFPFAARILPAKNRPLEAMPKQRIAFKLEIIHQ